MSRQQIAAFSYVVFLLAFPVNLLGQEQVLAALNQPQADSCLLSPGSWGAGNATLGLETVSMGVTQITWTMPDVCGQSDPQLMLVSIFDPPAEIESDCTFNYSYCGPPEFGYDIRIEFFGGNTASCELTPTMSSGVFPFGCSTCDETLSMTLTFVPVAAENTTWGLLKSSYR